MSTNFLVYPIEISQTASSGVWSFNTIRFSSSKLTHIVVKAASGSTTFKFKITDDKDNIVYDTVTNATGTHRQQVEIPVKGIYTIAVYDSSVDEIFSGRLMYEE